MRIRAYKQLAEANSLREIKQIEHDWRDQFGKLPHAVNNLLGATRLKLHAAKAHITSIELQGQRLMLTRNGNYIQLDGARFPRLKSIQAKDKLTEAIKLLQNI